MLTPQAHLTLLKHTSWSGYVYILFLLVGMSIAGFLPSQPATMGPQEIAQVYLGENLWNIRIGMAIALVGSMFYVPWTAILAKLVMRVEGKAGILTYCMVIAGCTNVLLTAYPTGYWLLGTFRPDRDPALIQLINDISWSQFLGVITPFYFVPISIAYAALADKDPNPLIPRWVGWFNIWFELSLIPLVVIFWFHTGPFAWNGLFGFYLPFFIFFLWFFVMTWTIRRSLHRLDEV
ncbi:MAG TPA: hypothetical protein VFY31_03825 [Macromonas sp.]|nr:hypothetical protein [Macromonas sp.]